jgi:hypothetical protein
MDSWTRHRDFFSKGDPGRQTGEKEEKIVKKERLETRRRAGWGEGGRMMRKKDWGKA